MQFRRILVIRLRLMGDVLLVTPVLEALRRSYPESHIALLADAPHHEVALGHPALNEVIVFKRPGFANFLRTLRYVRRQKFDLVINLHPHGERAPLLTWLSGARCRVGFARPGSPTFMYNVRAPYRLEDRYRVDHLLDAVRALGVEAKPALPSIALTDDERAFAEKFVARGKRPLVIIHPGRPDTRRAWMVDRYAQVADTLIDRHGARVVFVGIASEAPRVEAIRARMQHPAEAEAGTLTVKQMVAIMERSDLFIGMDSSPLHMASAVGLPTVSLFSYYSPSEWKPLGERHIAIRRQVPGRPCSANCCEHGNAACMRNISVDEVLQAATQLLCRT